MLQPGHDVLIDDGLVRLRVDEVSRGRARCAVLVGGAITSHKGVNLPGVPLPIPSLTRKDNERSRVRALHTGVDFVALSFVRSAADVRDLRSIIEQHGSHAHVIAKIEKAEAVDVLDDVLAETDAVMVARGDLGVEIGAALVPLLQKRIIAKSLERGKPVITATQMLESMVHSAEPTRAEASDVANAILDGTSAVMLSGETAVGEYPVEAVAYMDRIARAVEPSMGYRHELPEAAENPTIGGAMSNAACDLAEALRAAAILVPTFTGRTASAVARLRPRRPIVAFTHVDWAMRQLALEWGVTPLLINECTDVEDLWSTSIAAARERGARRDRRPRRHHRRHRGEHPRLDERDQGGYRLNGTAAGSDRDARGQPRLSSVGDGSFCAREALAHPRASSASLTLRASSGPGACRPAVAGNVVLRQNTALDDPPPLACRRGARARRAPLLPPAEGVRRRARAARAAAGGRAAARAAEGGPRAAARLVARRSRRVAREARALGYVKPGEHLFIVKDIDQWRKRQRASLQPHGH